MRCRPLLNTVSSSGGRNTSTPQTDGRIFSRRAFAASSRRPVRTETTRPRPVKLRVTN